MKKKYLAKLLSCALSAAMALTSVVPSYAAAPSDLSARESSDLGDAEQEEEQDPDVAGETDPDIVTPADEDAEDTGDDSSDDEGDVTDSDAEPEDAEEETAVEEEALKIAAAEEEEEAELESTDDVTIIFDRTMCTNIDLLDPDSENGEGTCFNDLNEKWKASLSWDSESESCLEIKVVPGTGYLLVPDKQHYVTYKKGGENRTVTKGEYGYQYKVSDDGTEALFTLSKAALSLCKKEGNEGTMYVVFDKDTAVADTFEIKIIGDVEAATVTEKYNDTQVVIDLAEYQKPGIPVTGVKVYINDGTGEGDILTEGENDDYVWNEGSGVVNLTGKAVEKAYAAGKSLTIEALSRYYTVSQAESDYGTELQFELGYADAGMFVGNKAIENGIASDYEKDLGVKIKPSNADTNEREIAGARATVTYSDGTTGEYGLDNCEDSNENPVYWVLYCDYLYDNETDVYANNVVITVKTRESVCTDAPGVTVYNAGGRAVQGNEYVATGDDYTFSIKVNSPETKVKSVGYRLGDSEEVNDLPLTTDNTYTVPEVTDTLTIVVETEGNEKDTAVSTDADSEKFAVLDRNTGKPISSSAALFAKKGEAYYFKVSPKAGNFIKAVTYSVNATAPVKAQTTATSGVYMIPATRKDGAIVISVEGYETVAVERLGNEKIVIEYNGATQSSRFNVRGDEDFTFTIKGAASEGKITISHVSVNIAGEQYIYKALDDVDSYTITIKSEDLTGRVTVDATTSELIVVEDDSIKLRHDSNSKYETDEDGKDVEPLNLLVAKTEETWLNPEINIKGESDLANFNVTCSSLSGTDNYVAVGELTERDSAKAFNVQAKNIGIDAIVADFESKKESNYYNTVIYRKVVSVEVMPRYVITLQPYYYNYLELPLIIADEVLAGTQGTAAKKALAAKSDEQGGTRVDIVAEVKNGATGSKKDISDIPGDATISWSGEDDNFLVTEGSLVDKGYALAAGDLGIRVAAESGSDTPGVFNITITDGDDVYTAEQPVEFYAVDKSDLYVKSYVIVDVPGGATYINPEDAITLDEAELKKANIEYKVYQVYADYIWKLDTKEPGFLDRLDAAEKAGDIEDIRGAVEDEELFKDSDYLTVTGSKGKYEATVSGSGYGETTLCVSGRFNNIDWESDRITFNVIKSPAKVRIPVITNDSFDANNDGQIEEAEEGNVVIRLTSDYLNEVKTYSRGYDKDHPADGYLFKVSAGTQFTLPTDAQWEGDKETNTKRALVGWEILADEGAIRGVKTGENPVYFAPGATIIPEYQVYDENSGKYISVEIKSISPVWVDRYRVKETFRNVIEKNNNTDELVENEVELSKKAFSVNTADEEGVPIFARVGTMIPVADGVAVKDECPPASAVEGVVNTIYWEATDVSEGGEESETLTVLDREALDKGYIKGVKPGSALIYAVYTDEYSNKYYSAEETVKVEAAPDYALEYDASFPESIEVGQAVTSEVKFSKVVEEDEDFDTTGGTFEWNISGSGEVSIEGDKEFVITGKKNR